MNPTTKQPRLLKVECPLSARLGPSFFRLLPRSPGVYFFYDQNNVLLYIGQSGNLRDRIGSYRHVNEERHSKRILRLVGRTFRVRWQECASPEEAMLMESRLLLEMKPPFNRAGVWRGEPWRFVCNVEAGGVQMRLTRNETSPDFILVPSSFRYVFATLTRCLLRVLDPARKLHEMPVGLVSHRPPLQVSLEAEAPEETVGLLRSFVARESDELLRCVVSVLSAVAASECAFWDEELETLRRYASKPREAIEHSAPSSKLSPALFPEL